MLFGRSGFVERVLHRLRHRRWTGDEEGVPAEVLAEVVPQELRVDLARARREDVQALLRAAWQRKLPTRA